MAKKYFIGTSGWNYKHWKKIFYPEGLGQKNWFEFYADNFDTVEVNYSFYRWPRKETLEKWEKDSPKDFEFTLKAPRIITHSKKFKNAENQTADFYELAKNLKRKIGCFLFQTPPSFVFSIENLSTLENFFKTLDGKKRNVIEFRDYSWWNSQTYDLLKKYNVIFCVVSGLDMPDTILTTSNISYFRFHGAGYSSDYSKEDLFRYADAMKKLDSEKVYTYFNNDIGGFAPKNALMLKDLLL